MAYEEDEFPSDYNFRSGGKDKPKTLKSLTSNQIMFEKYVEQSHGYARERVRKLISDTNLSKIINSNQYFLIEDSLAEAYRAAAIDIIFTRKDE